MPLAFYRDALDPDVIVRPAALRAARQEAAKAALHRLLPIRRWAVYGSVVAGLATGFLLPYTCLVPGRAWPWLLLAVAAQSLAVAAHLRLNRTIDRVLGVVYEP